MRPEYQFMTFLEGKYGLRGCEKSRWNTHGTMPVLNRSCDFAFPFVQALRHRLGWAIAAYDAVKEWEEDSLPDVNDTKEHKFQKREGSGGWCGSDVNAGVLAVPWHEHEKGGAQKTAVRLRMG